MKRIKKIVVLTFLFIVFFYNICFADAIMIDPITVEEIIGQHYNPLVVENKVNLAVYIFIGILILLSIICGVILFKKIFKKKEREFRLQGQIKS